MPDIIIRKVVNNENIKQTKEDTQIKNNYPMNDLGSVFSHYNPETGKNEPTENKL